MPNSSQRVLMYGQSKLSPLYVTTTCGCSSRMCAQNLRSVLPSSVSLKTVNGPGNSDLGVYSKSAMSSETTSRLMIRNPMPSIM